MMIEDFKLLALRETVRDAAVHDLVNCGESWQSIFDRCIALSIPSGTVAAALVINLLKRNHIKEAAEIGDSFNAIILTMSRESSYIFSLQQKK